MASDQTTENTTKRRLIGWRIFDPFDGTYLIDNELTFSARPPSPTGLRRACKRARLAREAAYPELKVVRVFRVRR